MNRPMPPGRPPLDPTAAAQAAAQAEAEYQADRTKMLVAGAGALLLADTIARGLLRPDENEGAPNRITAAFGIAEAFIAEAEKRLGGKLTF